MKLEKVINYLKRIKDAPKLEGDIISDGVMTVKIEYKDFNINIKDKNLCDMGVEK